MVSWTSEFPLQVGGLGDVVTGLARACIARGHTTEVILPYYECLNEEDIQDLVHEYAFDCPKGWLWEGQWQQGTLKTDVWSGKIAGEFDAEEVGILSLLFSWGGSGNQLVEMALKCLL